MQPTLQFFLSCGHSIYTYKSFNHTIDFHKHNYKTQKIKGQNTLIGANNTFLNHYD